MEVDGQFADTAPGRCIADAKKFTVALEGKGTCDPLNRSFSGRRMSAVHLACRRAINLPRDWIVVTSIRDTRLYRKGPDQHPFERFETARKSPCNLLLDHVIFAGGVWGAFCAEEGGRQVNCCIIWQFNWGMVRFTPKPV